MGITGLTATLQPYGQSGVLTDQNVVIDGPALAYTILYICRSNGISQPSYDLLGRSVIQWLDTLALQVEKIDAIYFDAYLPVGKRDVRMDRSAKLFIQLMQFCNNCPKGCDSKHLFGTPEDNLDLFTTKLPSTHKQLVPPSFLVPAIIDALDQCSRYRHLVSLVPGEADAFCAHHLAAHGGIVLTSDSDLLVHDLGQGKVVFFRDIHASATDTWKCIIYDSRNICERLGLKPSGGNICRFGYEVYREPHASISQLVQNCSSPIPDEAEYDKFCQQYLQHELANLPVTAQGETVQLRNLDPRISELVLQLGSSTEDAPIDSSIESRMFLPVLIENPLRGSAWEPCTPIRQLAYTIYRWIVPGPNSTVHEYRRVQNVGHKGREVSMIPQREAIELLQSLLQTLQRTKDLVDGVDGISYWTLLCMALNIKECQEQDKQSHILQILTQSSEHTSLKPGSKIPWDTIHATAHLQASLYSFRILKQILSLVPNDAWTHLPSEAKELHETLKPLPGFTDFPSVKRTEELLQKKLALETLDLLRSFVHIPVRKVKEKKALKKRKKDNKGNGLPTKRLAAPKIRTGGSIFSLLADDE
ncbi:unnamed protein product [Clonostachys rosea]|uniref:Asteroid domain-containing protein n=1 Tax=Bionectria ochroleuca TaxID=29856 RepID=A0ABY6TQC7_BIOOC|nr:unnamed protein product [Clonostachys rosea]